jgi:hypothetical protein
LQQFSRRFEEQIAGILSGWDRLVFRGSLRRLNYGYFDPRLNHMVAVGMEQYLWQKRVLFKDYGEYVKAVSEQLKRAVLGPFEEQGRRTIFLDSPGVNKEERARAEAARHGIESGVACMISALEPSPTFEHRGTHIIRRIRPCHVLYQYRFHPQIGWMHARIQTWFPFNIQIAINGREWLARQMDREGLGYLRHGNCFVHIEDYSRAQQLVDEQMKTAWPELLNGIGAELNPVRESVFECYPCDYYWTVYQSEWATDITFRNAAFLERMMPHLTRHGMLDFSSPDVLRFLDRKLTRSGNVPARFSGSLETDLKLREEGERVKYRMNANSIKFYDKAYTPAGAVLRAAETTLNDVSDFRVYRPKEGGDEKDLQWRVMRKSVADLHRRAEVSQRANERLIDALASVDDMCSVEELTRSIQQPATLKGRRVRALRPWSDDRKPLEAINHGEFAINGFRNRDLQKLLYAGAASEPEARRRSAAVSRLLRLLRAHGLIQKVPRTHRYNVTPQGRTVILAVLTTARTSLHQINQLARAA